MQKHTENRNLWWSRHTKTSVMLGKDQYFYDWFSYCSFSYCDFQKPTYSTFKKTELREHFVLIMFGHLNTLCKHSHCVFCGQIVAVATVITILTQHCDVCQPSMMDNSIVNRVNPNPHTIALGYPTIFRKAITDIQSPNTNNPNSLQSTNQSHQNQ